MIEEGDGWKFTSHIEETAIHEDQLVEHVLTGHRAVRRVYSKRLNLDEEATAAVRRQVEISAAIEHPGFQRIFFSELVEDQLCLYGEHMDGTTLDTMTRHKKFKKCAEWAEAALLVVEMARAFESLGIGFDRLTLASMKLRWGVLRTATRYPAGSIVPGVLPESRFLRRLLEIPEIGGAYVAEAGVPVEAGLQRLKDLFYFMASGQTVMTVEQAFAKAREKEAETGTRSMSQLGIEAEAEAVLLRLHEPGASKGISNLRDLRRAVALLVPGVARPAISSPQIPMMAPPPAFSAPAAPSPTSRISTAALVQPSVVPSSLPPPSPPPRAAPETPAREQEQAPAAEQRTSSDAARRSSSSNLSLEMTGRGRMDEDADEDRSYLYPSASPAATAVSDSDPGAGSESAGSESVSSGSGSRLSSGSVRKPPSAAGAKSRDLLRFGLIALVFVALLAGAAYVGLFIFDFRRPNLPPTAMFAELPGQIYVKSPFTLDASPSSDPEGKRLRYQWSIPGLDVTNYKITPNFTTEAQRATLEVFVSGTFEVKLEVFDGLNLSQPVSQTIEVRQPR